MVDCTNCQSNCCIGLDVAITADEYIELMTLNIPSGKIKRVVKSYYMLNPCGYFDAKTQKCKIYGYRPMKCRNFPFNFLIQNNYFYAVYHPSCPQIESEPIDKSKCKIGDIKILAKSPSQLLEQIGFTTFDLQKAINSQIIFDAKLAIERINSNKKEKEIMEKFDNKQNSLQIMHVLHYMPQAEYLKLVMKHVKILIQKGYQHRIQLANRIYYQKNN